MVNQHDDEDDEDWVFDTVKAPTMKGLDKPEKPKDPREPEYIAWDEEDLEEDFLDDPSQLMEDMHISTPPALPKPVASSTVRRTPIADRSPSVRRLTSTKRRSSVAKQPLGVDLSFGNSPSTVRQFRRLSDKLPPNSTTSDIPSSPHYLPSGGASSDENASPKTLFSEPQTNSKEVQLGRRVYSKAVGLSCQEVLATTADQEKRDALSRLAEAWSDLEMVDPEGLYHVIRSMNEKIQDDPKLSSSLLAPSSPPAESSPHRPARLVLAQNNPHLKSHRRRQSTAVPESPLHPAQIANLPGQQVPGMEHTKQLSDVLYSRWAEGLRNRWPAV